MKLLYAARPQHFVLVGLVLGGLYVYNSDTVEVCMVFVLSPYSFRREVTWITYIYMSILPDDRSSTL